MTTKHLQTFESFLNEAKDMSQLASELVEIAADYVDGTDMTPEMTKAKSVEDQDELEDFYEELYTEVADLGGTEAGKFEKEARAFLKKNGIKI